VTLDDLIDGVKPDIVGELFVLDQLDTPGTTRLATTTLLHHAFHSNPDAYQGFVERAATDHTEHPRLLDLLIASVSDESSAASAELAVAIIPLLKRSDHPALTWIFNQLACVHDHVDPDRIGRLLATARFRFANLVMGEGDMDKAFELLTQALAPCNPAWPQYGNILNNRGITLLQLGQPKAAITDFSVVIDAAAASNEARACALNNRADVLFDNGDVGGAISDRSAVLALTNTTYNRRYIALARRAVALRRLEDEAGAYQDIETILATSDIAIEQKMAARLMRAKWLLEAGDITKAQADLDHILTSYRNFDNVEQKARELRTPQAAKD
jgi:tetratricopeptide (TPR) repeat protein